MLDMKFYDKEEIKAFALSHALVENSDDEEELYRYYLVLNVSKDAIIKQAEAIKLIASENNCVIVGRAADYILKDNPNLIKIFLYAPLDYRINKVKEVYKDNEEDAKKHIIKSDKARAAYYEVISNQTWGSKENYDLCLNCEMGAYVIVKIICDYVKNKNNSLKR